MNKNDYREGEFRRRQIDVEEQDLNEPELVEVLTDMRDNPHKEPISFDALRELLKKGMKIQNVILDY